MIPLKFGLFWSGAPLSYLRYLTFKTLRLWHPDAEIELYLSRKFQKDGFNWQDEKQDFQNIDHIGQNYLGDLNDLKVRVIPGDFFAGYPSNFQSDLFRWWWLKNNNGFYLDADQIILKSFETLPLDNNLIYSAYPAQSCGFYSPVGVIGAENSEMVNWIHELLPQFYVKDNYNSMGPFMFRAILGSRPWKDKMFNAPPNIFYPIPESQYIGAVYSGDFKIPAESFALHLYGGHPLTQEFNRKYTEEFARTGTDTVSKYLREKGLV
jgi:hypothetical protein